MFGVEEFGRLFIMLVGILGNGSIVRLVTKDALMQTLSNKLLLVIAISDLGTCVVTMSFSFISMIANRWLFGQTLCDIIAFFCDFFFRVSSLTIPLVVYQKHLSITSTNAMRHSNQSIKKYIIFFCLLASAFSLPYHPKEVHYDPDILACKLYFPRRSSGNIALMFFAAMESLFIRVIPNIVMFVSFVKIIKVIRLRRRALKSRKLEPKPVLYKLEHLRILSDGYTALTTLIMALAFIALSIPNNTLSMAFLFQNVLKFESKHITFKVAAFWCMLINPVLRPLIYGLRHARCWRYVSRCYQRMRRYFMMHGLCLKTASRSSAYVIPQVNTLELKPGAFGSINNVEENRVIRETIVTNYGETIKSKVSRRLSVVDIAPSNSVASVSVQRSIQSVIILERENFAIEFKNASNCHQSETGRENVLEIAVNNKDVGTQHQSEVSKSEDEMVVEDIEVYAS